MKRATVEPSARRDPLAAVEQAAIAEEALAVMRHDVRNKLATMRNAVYFLQQRLGGSAAAHDPRVMQFLNALDSEVVAADEKLSSSQIVERFFNPVEKLADASECIERGAALARCGERRVRVTLALAPGRVAVCPETLTMMVRHLVENAIEATPDGGEVFIEAAPAPDGAAFLIKITDEGVGLPSGPPTTAFEPFFSTKPGHVGLGLCIASRAARRAKGKICLSQVARGVLTSLSLPLALEDEASAGPVK